MKGFLAIALREIDERKRVLAVAAAASLIPFAVPIVRGLSGPAAAEARSVTALFLCLAFAGGIAVGLGATLLVPSMANRRIGFDFARPVSAFGIWGGRIAAALALALATALIVWIPARLAGPIVPGGDLFAMTGLPRSWPLLAVASLLTLYCLLHTVVLAFRSRSVLLLADAVFAAAALMGASAAATHLYDAYAAAPHSLVVVLLSTAAVTALACAGYASVLRGRTDLHAAHAASSIVLWSIVGAAVLGANGYAYWVTAAGPSDLDGWIWATPAAKGPWVELGESARGARANFLYDTATGRFARTGTRDWAVSRDGKRAAWVKTDSREGPHVVWAWALEEPSAKPAQTRIALNGSPELMELSADGSRLATMGDGLLSIHDLRSGTTLVTARVPTSGGQSVRALFIANDRLRIYRAGDTALDVLELDVSSRSLTQTGRIAGLDGLRHFVTDPTGSRVITTDGSTRRKKLFDGRSGDLLATLVDAAEGSRWPRFLSGGRIVLTERSSSGLRLLLFGADGQRGPVIPMPNGSQVVAGGELGPGRLIVGIADEKFHYASWLVDLDAATARKIADDLWPVDTFWSSSAVGSDATTLFYGPAQRQLVRLNPLTGERRVLLGAR